MKMLIKTHAHHQRVVYLQTWLQAVWYSAARLRVINSEKIPALNRQLQQYGIAAVPTVQPSADPLCVP
jgi:hypothetical protein